jgi:predicted O-methyltransferase YrrM
VTKSTRTVFRELNDLLGSVHVRLADGEAHAAEMDRLRRFEAAGGLDRPVYALSPGMAGFDPAPMVEALAAHGSPLERLMRGTAGAAAYQPQNGYFDSPDAETLYLMMRRLQPERVIEVGCGNSTRITRQAALDSGVPIRITAIDPRPRADIAQVADEVLQVPVEEADPARFAALGAGDVLFIDSSHALRVSNDVAHLFCRIIPALAAGVVIHVHDVFLPYEYPKRFFYDCPSWGEQYILHALLSGGGYDILWPGHYLQRARADAVLALPFLSTGRAQSFWFRKK